MKYEKERSWSLISPKPILFYDETLDEHLVYWNGYLMTYLMGFNQALGGVGIYPTPQMKLELFNHWKKLVTIGVFEGLVHDLESWSSERLYSYIRKMPHLTKYHTNITITEILNDFDLERLKK